MTSRRMKGPSLDFLDSGLGIIGRVEDRLKGRLAETLPQPFGAQHGASTP